MHVIADAGFRQEHRFRRNSVIHPLWLAVPLVVIEVVSFYVLHWPHRELFPKRFRLLILAKGVLRGATHIALAVLFSTISLPLGWAYVIGHTMLGLTLHVIWCRKHNIDPLRVQPRERYVAASAAWFERLIALENAKGRDSKL